jgi:hypothetical protein
MSSSGVVLHSLIPRSQTERVPALFLGGPQPYPRYDAASRASELDALHSLERNHDHFIPEVTKGEFVHYPWLSFSSSLLSA